MIKLEHVSIKYIKEYYSLYNINFEIDKNTVLLGDEASGNNFVLRILAKIDKHYEGNVFIDNENLKEIKDKALNLAYIPKQIYLFKNKSVYKNLIYPLKIRKIDTKTANNAILNALKKCNIEKFLIENNKNLNKNENKIKTLQKIKVKNLYPSMQKILMLLRAIIRQPKYILLENFFENLTEKYTEVAENIINSANYITFIASEKDLKFKCFNTFNKIAFDAGSIIPASKTQ